MGVEFQSIKTFHNKTGLPKNFELDNLSKKIGKTQNVINFEKENF